MLGNTSIPLTDKNISLYLSAPQIHDYRNKDQHNIYHLEKNIRTTKLIIILYLLKAELRTIQMFNT